MAHTCRMPSPSVPRATDAALAEVRAIVADLTPGLPVVAATMFGMPSVRYSAGKAFIGTTGDHLIFKLSGTALADALALEGAALFDPMHGRPMRQWVVVPSSHRDRYLDLAREAARTDGPPGQPEE